MSMTISQYVEKYIQAMANVVKARINGKDKYEEPLNKQMLESEYTTDLKWGSYVINNSISAADVVSMGSSLPLKKRDSIEAASGVIPKIGMKYQKDEAFMKMLDVMMAQGIPEAEIAQKVLDDVEKCAKGVSDRIEYMFLQALSTGFTSISDDAGDGLGVRIDFGYRPENIFRSNAPWGTAAATPQSDLDEVFEKVENDGNSIAVVMMSKKYFNFFKTSTQGKVIAANYQNHFYSSAANLPTPSNEAFRSALEDLYGCEFEVVNRSVRIEKGGRQTSVKPWAEANVVFLYDRKVGRRVWTNCVEATHPVAGTQYQTMDDGALISIFHSNDPWGETTCVQNFILPVIDGVEQIYMLEADKAALAFSPAGGLTFTSSANNTGKTVTVTTDADSVVSAEAEGAPWLTLSVAGKVVTAKVSANTASGAAARSATVTVTDANGATGAFTVNQSA